MTHRPAQISIKHPESGTVLLEYVFLLVIIALEIVLYGNRFYIASEGMGSIGLALQAAWQRIMVTIALPVP